MEYNRNKRPAIERFLEKIIFNKVNGCWEWKAALNGNGYAQFERGIGSRWSFKYYIGDIPLGYDVCHKCDNTKCVNPFHLFAGTRKDNLQDMLNKGRKIRRDHPSYRHYIVHGCRCEDCKQCYRDYYKANKDKYLLARRKYYANGRKEKRYDKPIPKSNM